MGRTIVLASNNPGKLAELLRLLPEGLNAVLAADLGVSFLPETGSTFTENALIKARHTAQTTGQMAIGDDSGLEVDALEGAPGVYSARYAGEPVSDARNIDKLLAALNGVEPNRRTARFRCAVAVVTPEGHELVAEGAVDGVIGESPRGDRGFGYDPVFVIGDGRTFAELKPAEKDEISHRGVALRALMPKLARLAEDYRNEHVNVD